MDCLKGGFMTSKKEVLKQLKEAQKKFIEDQEATRPDNPHHKKGRRSFFEMYHGITRHNKKSLADY